VLDLFHQTNAQHYWYTNAQRHWYTNAQRHWYTNTQRHWYTNAQRNWYTNAQATGIKMHNATCTQILKAYFRHVAVQVYQLQEKALLVLKTRSQR
jgi:hypothetical protein